MHDQGLFLNAFVYLSAAVISVPIAKRLGLGSVLGYLIAGMIIGPFVLGLVGQEGQDVMHFAEFGVVMMLFLVGLELQPSLLWRLRGPILGTGGLQVGLTTVLISGIALALGLHWKTALVVGMILSLSSTAIVLQTLAEKGLMKSDAGQNSFAVLLFQDIAVIPMLAILPLLAMSPSSGSTAHADSGHAADAAHAATWIEGFPGWAQTLLVLGAVITIVVAGRFLIRPAFRFIAKARLREIFTAAALLLVIGIALLMTLVGLSPALGTFLAGVVLAESEYRHELESDIEPFKGLLLGVFFIAVGASIDFSLIGAQPGLIAGLVGALLVVKLLVLFVLGRVFKMGLDQNLIFAFALAQGGEFAFVLFSFATQGGILPNDVVGILVAVVAVSMALTPFLMLLNEKVFQPRFGTKEQQDREPDQIDEENPVIVAGFGDFGSVVGRFLQANGVSATVLEYDSDKVEILRKLGLKVFYGDASRHDLLHAAGAESAKLIILAIGDIEKTRGMVETVRKHFPHLRILVRADGRRDAYQLMEMGVGHVYRDTLDTSLRVGSAALRMLGHRSHQATRATRSFRKLDEATARELSGMRHDQKAYLNVARQRIRDLEESLLTELDAGSENRDVGWDTTSLRREFGQ